MSISMCRPKKFSSCRNPLEKLPEPLFWRGGGKKVILRGFHLLLHLVPSTPLAFNALNSESAVEVRVPARNRQHFCDAHRRGCLVVMGRISEILI